MTWSIIVQSLTYLFLSKQIEKIVLMQLVADSIITKVGFHFTDSAIADLFGAIDQVRWLCMFCLMWLSAILDHVGHSILLKWLKSHLVFWISWSACTCFSLTAPTKWIWSMISFGLTQGSSLDPVLISLTVHSFIHSEYFYSASSSPLLLRGAPDYSIDTVSELTCRSATGNCKWSTYPRSFCGIRTCDLLYTRHWTYHWAAMHALLTKVIFLLPTEVLLTSMLMYWGIYSWQGQRQSH